MSRPTLGAPAALFGVTLAALLLWPRLALACPQCAGGQGRGTGATLLLLGLILLPFVVAAVVVRLVRRLAAKAEDPC